MAHMWNIVGHDAAVARFTRSLREGQAPHAYLIAGPAQTGKRTLATAMAMAWNCDGLDEDGGPCGRCRSCRRIADGKHSDVLTVGLPSHDEPSRKNIGIDQVREIGRFVTLEPFEGRRRVVIIDGAETLSTEAANAFLKTLEEPPAAVSLILLTDQEEALLETVRSRCQRLALSPLPRRIIAQALVERWGAAAEQADLLAGLSRGRIGWAVAALSDASVLAHRAETLDMIHSLALATRSGRLAYAADLATRFGRDRTAVLWTLDLWREWWRDVLHVSAGTGLTVTNVDDLPAITKVAAQCSMKAIVLFLESLKRTGTYLQQNVNPRLALEVLFLDLPQAAPREPAGLRAPNAVPRLA
jgi:DNA polymerase-3 subunit delta'